MSILAENKELARIITKYLVGHSGRRLNYLFWNIIHRKDRVLCFVNQIGKDLNTINDPNTCVRFVKAKDISEWTTICDLLDRIVGIERSNEIFIIRVDMLVAYLNKLSFDLGALILETSAEKSIYYVAQIKDNKSSSGFTDRHNHIAYPSNDLHNEYFMKKFKDLYVPILVRPKEEHGDIFDATKAYMISDGIEYNFDVIVNEKKKIVVPVITGPDFPPQRFIVLDNDGCRNDPVLQIIRLPGSIVRYVYVYRSDKLDAISARVYLNYFLSVK